MLSTPIASETETLRSVADMTTREFYSGIALWGLVSAMAGSDSRGNRTNTWKPEHIADKSVQLADEMIRRLER